MSELPLPAIFLFVSLITVPALFYFFIRLRTNRQNKSDATSWKEQLVDSSKEQQQQSASSSSADDAWEERRRRGIAAASSHVKKDAPQQKPFGSSYYYAHNNTQATGGYKDGLSMEDYTMNGPRLLSRGGKPVSETGSGGSNVDLEPAPEQRPLTSTSNSNGNTSKQYLPISKYLWDDPGDASKGVATIRIDRLPGRTSTDAMIDWKDIEAENISAELVEEGLLVTIETTSDVNYCLRIPKLYGQVSDVKTINKKDKRLLIRLTKKKGLIDKSNLKAWPHPQKKML